jgi:DNA-binding XRE family transcriptional regulator
MPQATMPHAASFTARKASLDLGRLLRLERSSFGAKVRAARAVLNLNQREFGQAIGLTQKSVHRIEHGMVDPSMRTIVRIQHFWEASGVYFEDLQDGGFRLVVNATVLGQVTTTE